MLPVPTSASVSTSCLQDESGTHARAGGNLPVKGEQSHLGTPETVWEGFFFRSRPRYPLPSRTEKETFSVGFQCLSFQGGFAGSAPEVGEDPVHGRCVARGYKERQHGFQTAPTSKEQLGQSSDFLKAVNINNTPAKHRHRRALVTTRSEIACLTFGLASSVPLRRNRAAIALQVLNDGWQSRARGRRERSQGGSLHLASCFGEKGLCLG